MEDLRYPIGKYVFNEEISRETIDTWIEEIYNTPTKLRQAVQNLGDNQLDTPYRPEGWTIRQVIHHLVDSHMNSYVRFKLALTEDNPTIKPYSEDRWAELPDSKLPIEISLDLLGALHKRWVYVLRNISPTELKKTFQHPDSGEITLEQNIGLYDWHCRHHIAHITSLRKRLNW
ncbi:YfiT family bacillithiol transferase [Peribacillus alkalitolerans]|uniref:YfiT family bacillithiol transferase n=1 Tax=Peribacillus alkalitolerans TaxID=1550385 RepID=UPI0013D501E6|nr:bacillithiol transferase BstA [Peribacillus alkalitolerans]